MLLRIWPSTGDWRFPSVGIRAQKSYLSSRAFRVPVRCNLNFLERSRMTWELGAVRKLDLRCCGSTVAFASTVSLSEEDEDC